MNNMKKKKIGRVFLILLLYIGNTFVTFSDNNEIDQSQRRVTGRVTDVKGEFLVGVNVVEVGTTNGTVTDIDGNYSINLISNNPTLRFTYIGFKPLEVVVGSQRVINVALEEDVETLDEVVVVGYGTQKKASVVGAITSIAPEELRVTPSRTISNNLAGKIAGIIAVQRSGDPWFSNSDFWIRGVNSFRGITAPLVLIDGVERDLNNIDPNEIESFSVLKDAAASAVYGVRGANGVIMITTKKGKIGPGLANLFETKS